MQDFFVLPSLGRTLTSKAVVLFCHPHPELMKALGLALCCVGLETQWGPGQTLSLPSEAPSPVGEAPSPR